MALTVADRNPSKKSWSIHGHIEKKRKVNKNDLKPGFAQRGGGTSRLFGFLVVTLW